jgi:transcriptional regulator with XRE-family HTH domain
MGLMNATLKPASRLKSWRVASGYSLSEVSGLTGVSSAMWSRAERGERRFSAKAKVQISRRLGVAVTDLFEPEPIES